MQFFNKKTKLEKFCFYRRSLEEFDGVFITFLAPLFKIGYLIFPAFLFSFFFYSDTQTFNTIFGLGIAFYVFLAFLFLLEFVHGSSQKFEIFSIIKYTFNFNYTFKNFLKEKDKALTILHNAGFSKYEMNCFLKNLQADNTIDSHYISLLSQYFSDKQKKTWFQKLKDFFTSKNIKKYQNVEPSNIINDFYSENQGSLKSSIENEESEQPLVFFPLDENVKTKSFNE